MPYIPESEFVPDPRLVYNRLSPPQVNAAAHSLLCSIELVLNQRHATAEGRAEAIVNVATAYAKSHELSVTAWPAQLGRHTGLS